MNNSALKFGFIVLILTFSIYFSFPWASFGLNNFYSGNDYKLGLDLKGGVELDYKIDLDEAKKRDTYNENNIVEGLKAIVEKRVNSLGTAEPTILSSKYGNESHIIVQIPSSNFAGQNLTDTQIQEKNNEYIQKAKETIGKVVRLEFKEKKTQITDADKKERRDIADKIKEELSKNETDFKIAANKFKDQSENVNYLSGSGSADILPKEVTFTGMENVKVPFVSDVIETQKKGEFTLGNDGNLAQGEAEKGYSIIKIKSIVKSEKERDVTTGTGKDSKTTKEKYTDVNYDYEAIFVNQKPSEWTAAKTKDNKVLDERYLLRSAASMSNGFTPEVDLVFNDEGKNIFAEITQRMVGQQLAIFVGGQLITAPTVNTVIPDGKAVITGSYTVDSAQKLANDIQTGIVPAPIYLTSERAIDAKIGGDALKVIIHAGIIGFVFILVFLITVYRFSGILAGVALFIYIALTLALVKLSGVVLTLASIAGLILSVGLAIDANILIFERSKEELKNKTEVTKALNIGFDRSWSAIWDAHVTTFVSAVILYLIGVNLIKGFGLMLGIGIVVSLFTAMWVSRILVLVFAPSFSKNLKAFIGISGR